MPKPPPKPPKEPTGFLLAPGSLSLAQINEIKVAHRAGLPLPHGAQYDVPPPPYDHCVGCPRVGRRGTAASRFNCSAHRTCIGHAEKFAPPRAYSLTAMDLVERAFGWACLGFAIGWIAGQAVMR